MKYRTYVNYGKGYKELGTYDSKKTYEILDGMILCDKTDKDILVIECDIANNSEFPVFIYVRNDESEYDSFRARLYSESYEKIKKKTLK